MVAQRSRADHTQGNVAWDEGQPGALHTGRAAAPLLGSSGLEHEVHVLSHGGLYPKGRERHFGLLGSVPHLLVGAHVLRKPANGRAIVKNDESTPYTSTREWRGSRDGVFDGVELKAEGNDGPEGCLEREAVGGDGRDGVIEVAPPGQSPACPSHRLLHTTRGA